MLLCVAFEFISGIVLVLVRVPPVRLAIGYSPTRVAIGHSTTPYPHHVGLQLGTRSLLTLTTSSCNWALGRCLPSPARVAIWALEYVLLSPPRVAIGHSIAPYLHQLELRLGTRLLLTLTTSSCNWALDRCLPSPARAAIGHSAAPEPLRSELRLGTRLRVSLAVSIGGLALN